MVVTCLQNHALVVPNLIYLNETSQLKIVDPETAKMQDNLNLNSKVNEIPISCLKLSKNDHALFHENEQCMQSRLIEGNCDAFRRKLKWYNQVKTIFIV